MAFVKIGKILAMAIIASILAVAPFTQAAAERGVTDDEIIIGSHTALSGPLRFGAYRRLIRRVYYSMNRMPKAVFMAARLSSLSRIANIRFRWP